MIVYVIFKTIKRMRKGPKRHLNVSKIKKESGRLKLDETGNT